MELRILRWLKKTFIRLRLHVLFKWVVPALEQIVWMTRLSQWASNHEKAELNDFPSRWDYNKRYPLYGKVVERERLTEPIDYLEFGVAAGHSFAWWMQQNRQQDSRFYGFDTFTGLPEDFALFKKGTFDMAGETPAIDDSRGRFFKGLFQETLPEFLREFRSDRKLVLMLDADLYSSTLFVLGSLAPYLKQGDVVFFDELSVPTHEFKALFHFMEAWQIKFEFIGAASNYYFSAFRVG